MKLRNREVRMPGGPSMQMLISPRLMVDSRVWNAPVSEVSRAPGRDKNDQGASREESAVKRGIGW